MKVGDYIKPKRTNQYGNLDTKVKRFNYKIKRCGKRHTLFRYNDIPLTNGFERTHDVFRRDNRTTANEKNVSRARQKVRDYVNTNWTEYTKMITLTYAKTMLDYDKLYMDYKAFIKHLKRKGINVPWLSITEPQKKRGLKEGNSGSLHLHTIVFSDEYIPYKTLKRAWGIRGSVHIFKLSDIDDKGAYISKYITKDTMPPDKKSFRTSRNIKKPSIERGLDHFNLIEQTVLPRATVISQDTYNMYELTNFETGELTTGNSVTITNYIPIEEKNK